MPKRAVDEVTPTLDRSALDDDGDAPVAAAAVHCGGGGDDDDDGGDDDGDVDMIRATLEFFDPQPADDFAMRLLLARYLPVPKAAFDVNDLAALIAAQSSVGTVVKIGDEIIGVSSCLNLHKYAASPSVQQIVAWLQNSAPGPAQEAMRQFLSDAQSPVGLIVLERYMNAPNEIAAPLVRGLFDEINWATTDEPTQERRDMFRLARYVLVSTATRVSGQTDDEEYRGAARSKRTQVSESTPLRPEDPCFAAHADFTYQVLVPSSAEQDARPTMAGDLTEWKTVMCFRAEKVPAILAQVEATLGPVMMMNDDGGDDDDDDQDA